MSCRLLKREFGSCNQSRAGEVAEQSTGFSLSARFRQRDSDESGNFALERRYSQRAFPRKGEAEFSSHEDSASCVKQSNPTSELTEQRAIIQPAPNHSSYKTGSAAPVQRFMPQHSRRSDLLEVSVIEGQFIGRNI
jgi:hypothetical protein